MLDTFQNRVLEFERLTRDMKIPEYRREININNVLWLKKNLERENSKHKNYLQAMKLIDYWYDKIYKSEKLF